MTFSGKIKMRKFGLMALGAAFLLAPALASRVEAQTVEQNILTGGATGTYIKIGNDISREAKLCGTSLHVRESAGSLENFLGVRKRPNTQFGIVQSDVLEYLKTYAADDPAVARAIRGVRIAFPLYNEEVHILARKDIPDLKGLEGKRVAIGVEDSGTYLTSSLILDLTGVNADRKLIAAGPALEALKAGEIDAFFYVAGAPTAIFASPDIDGTAFHLIPIRDKTLQTVYRPSSIDGGVYPFQNKPVETIAVKAVLMTYEYLEHGNNYHRASCNAVSGLSKIVLKRFENLKATGHPKWQDVDLNDVPPGWEIGSCVNRGLDPDYIVTCEGDETQANSAASEANEIYRKRICKTLGGC